MTAMWRHCNWVTMRKATWYMTSLIDLNLFIIYCISSPPDKIKHKNLKCMIKNGFIKQLRSHIVHTKSRHGKRWNQSNNNNKCSLDVTNTVNISIDLLGWKLKNYNPWNDWYSSHVKTLEDNFPSTCQNLGKQFSVLDLVNKYCNGSSHIFLMVWCLFNNRAIIRPPLISSLYRNNGTHNCSKTYI